MISNAKTLKAKAKATLGGKAFKGGWLWPIILGFIISALASILSPLALLTTAIFGVALATYYSALVRRTAEAKELGVYFKGFTSKIGSNIILGLVKKIYLFLWGIIPFASIIKTYSYAMTDFIKADNPELSANEVITKSRQMMNGYKWKFFCLELSFIGWYIFTAITFGVAGYWATPLINAAKAEFYEELKDIRAKETVVE